MYVAIMPNIIFFSFKDILYSLRNKLKVDVSDVSSAATFGNVQPLGKMKNRYWGILVHVISSINKSHSCSDSYGCLISEITCTRIFKCIQHSCISQQWTVCTVYAVSTCPCRYMRSRGTADFTGCRWETIKEREEWCCLSLHRYSQLDRACQVHVY